MGRIEVFDRRSAEAIVRAAEKLVEAIALDDNRSGGLLSRETIRAADATQQAVRMTDMG